MYICKILLIRMSAQNIITLSITLFAIIDILGSLPIIIDINNRFGKLNPLKITLSTGGIMIVFMYVGNQILKFMSVDVQSFAMAGAFIIFFMGLEMILNREFFKADKSGSNSSNTVVPIAFPLLAGAGTLTTLLSLKAAYNDVEIIIAIIVNLLFIYIVLLSTNRIASFFGPGGIAVLRKVFGVILLALAIKLFKTNLTF